MSSFFDPATEGVAYTKFVAEFEPAVEGILPLIGDFQIQRKIPVPQLLKQGILTAHGGDSIHGFSYRFTEDTEISVQSSVVARYGKDEVIISRSLNPAEEWQRCYIDWMGSRNRYNVPPAISDDDS